jgi:CSLREA domain-containing protein
VADGSTAADTDGDGVADCLDDQPLVAGTPVAPEGGCTYTVDTFADGDDGECVVDCTLREALGLAQGSVCTVQLSTGTYEVNLGSLELFNGVSIIGSGAADTIIDADIDAIAIVYQRIPAVAGLSVVSGLTLEHQQSGIRYTCDFCQLVLDNTVIRADPAHQGWPGILIASDYSRVDLNNTIVRDGGGIAINGYSGSVVGDDCVITESRRGVYVSNGIDAPSQALLTDCEVSNNGPLGAFYAKGSFSGPSVGGAGFIRLVRTVVKGNTATKGGAIYLERGFEVSVGGAAALIIDSTIEDNHASEAGGAVYIEGGVEPGVLNVFGSTLAGNTAPSGGGIYREAGECNLIFDYSTLSGNVAALDGGGIYAEEGCSYPMLRSSTVTNNQAAVGGGVYVESGVPLRLHNTIVGSNTAVAGLGAGPDCFGQLDSLGHVLIGSLDGCGFVSEPNDLLGVSPELGPLSDNGGPTRTHHPEPGSPVLDNGPLTCMSPDQRGVPRPQGPVCDIGSVEVAPDTDGDGVPDVIDGCPDDPDKADPGICGCGVPDTGDADGDEVLDCVDGCPDDPDKVEPGICGCGVPDTGDADGDGVLDCVDPCPTDPDFDGDGFGQTGDCPIGTPADCDDTDPTVFPNAPEVNDGLDNQCPGDFGYGMIDETTGNSGFHDPASKEEYSWPAQAGALSYEVWRASATSQDPPPILCTPTSDPFIIDPATPSPGNTFFYLNRATSPHVGSWGRDSSGQDRAYVSCPSNLRQAN